MGNPAKNDDTLIFNFKELKCTCPNEERKELPDFLSKPLSVGDTFLQYFYLSQRKLVYDEEKKQQFYGNSEVFYPHYYKMTLYDLIKVRTVADSMHFLRLYFLKTNNINSADVGFAEPELLDSVLAIFLFEVTRVHVTGRPIFSHETI